VVPFELLVDEPFCQLVRQQLLARELERATAEALRRWERSGAAWRVAARSSFALTVVRLTSDGGQEVQRLTPVDPGLLAFVGDRITNAP
jgi:hypothetical protein